MTALGRLFGTASVGAMLLACGNAPGEAEELGVTRQEVNACDETVPALRAVDGFPAYAQCDGIKNGAIWSNNGVDTASSSQGEGWVRTQWSGGYQCTEFARRYLMFRWGIDYQHGDAWEWCEGSLPSTLTLATSPTHGDLIVFAPGSCGSDATTGHIAVVDTVDMAGGKVTIVEQNQAGRRSTQQSCASCYLHAVKNDGSAGGAGTGGAGTAGAGGAGTAGAGGAGTAGAGGAGGAAIGGGAAAGGTTSATAGTAPTAGYPSGDPATGGAAGSSVVGAAGAAGAGANGSSTGVGGTAVAGAANGGGATSSSAAGNDAKDDASCGVALAAPKGWPSGLAGWLLVGAALRRRLAASRLRAGRLDRAQRPAVNWLRDGFLGGRQ
jgi:CHAP domain